ncbi:aminoglycoside 6'-N-acetyltransferase [Microvirga makkahensis]|uniref:Aminoglycoside N(6')-acetyltransferase type 1 n=1 Tax=Microvirga makkahensis TaxID=1128670 RepID=A0A7X3MTI9_9HYPH|nr:aminoglycoside 6'-N-acetyltransferase [Microvirga makkahensis]MXQ12939.1 GNAT family N-acetyltransferase [Microvirga makkahensis]
MRIVARDRQSVDAWVALRHEMWPDTSRPDHVAEAEAILADPEQSVAFLAHDSQGAAVAFAEAVLRHDYVNGCVTSPVAFLEGIYVRPSHRRQGIARLLVQAVESWAEGLGCAELASDVEIHNGTSQTMHLAVGFEETERVVYYRKSLPRR